MGKRSPEISELRCSSGLFSILECRYGCASHEPISKGRRPVKKDIIVNPRNVNQHHLSNIDEGCQKIQNEADLPSVSVDKDHIQEEKSVVNHKNKQIRVNAHQPAKKDSELVDHQVKTQKKAKKKSQNAYQSTSCNSNEETSLIHHLPSSSTEISLKNKLTIAAILSGVHDKKESSRLKKYDHLVEMRSEYFVDIHNDGASSESEPFSNALKVLNSKRDLVMEILRKDTKKGTSFTTQPSDKIVIMKPVALKSKRRSENVTCYCSSLQTHQKMSQRVPNAKNKSFSFKEVKKNLKHLFGGTRNETIRVPVDHTTQSSLKNSFDPSTNSKIKSALPSVEFSNELKFDLILEAKRHLSARLQNLNDTESLMSKRSPKTLGRILFSPEHEGWLLSPKSNNQSCSGSPEMRFSPYSYSHFLIATQRSGGITNERKRTSMQDISSCDNEKHEDEPKIVEMNCSKQRTDTIEYHNEDERSTMHSALPLLDSTSENETFTTTDGSQSPKCREEHQSPVSVLEPFFTECDNSPTSSMLQSLTEPLQALALDFEKCSYESPRQDQPITDEQDCIFFYVHSVLKASCLDWKKLSEIVSQPEELLHESLFNEVEFLSYDCFFDYKLLFDHINEILLQIYKSHCISTRLGFIKPEIRSVPLEKLVLDEILKEADFYILPVTEKRTLDQLVSKDMADSISWLNIRHDIEVIVSDVSEDIVGELMFDIILDERNT